MTSTWSVPSTQTICISPSAISSTPIRSIRLIVQPRPPGAVATEVVEASGGGLACDPVRAGDPLLLEQLAQAVLGRCQRDSCDHRLQETEHDDLARLVRRDATRLQVEELGLVDRADGTRVHRTAAVGVVDLEAGDGDRTGGLREIHAELAEEAVGAVG